MSSSIKTKPKMSRLWTFQVTCKTLPGEVVCVTGSCPELGNWKVNKIVHLEPQDTGYAGFGGEKEITWKLSLDLPQGMDISYRYAVCCFVEPQDSLGQTLGQEKKTVVRRWETSLRPRKITCHERCDSNVISTFGHEDSRVQRGWLVNETVVQLKIFGDKALNIWKKKHKGKDFYIKMTAVNANKSTFGEVPSSNDDSQSMDLCATRNKWQSWPIVEVAKLTDDECELSPQTQFGVLFEQNGFILFQAKVLEVPTVAFLVDIFARPAAKAFSLHEPAELIGSCYIMPNHFTSTSGTFKDTIISSSKFEAIGDICMDFLVIKSMENATCDFAVTFAKHWKPVWKGIDVGHRGLGNSYTKAESCSHQRENTISSLKNAYNHGADMVEFDVQLSKDKIPVIYHDFELCTSSVSRDGEQNLIPTQLKNLTLAQLRGLKIHHHSEVQNGLKEFTEESVEDRAFPTLEEALTNIDESCGFNIELKWDMMLKDGSNECHFAFEINLFLDKVLEAVLEFGSRRKIVFSSFNPDVCTIIRLKQNRYPVLLLTQGVNTKYDDYMDPRTWTIAKGSNFVSMLEILGVNVMAEDIQRDPSQVQMVKEKGQVMFVWTDDQSDSGTVKYLKELGVDGIIYDRMDVHNSKDIKQSVFVCPEEQEIEKMARSPKSACSCSPPGSPIEESDPENHPIEQSPSSMKVNTSFSGVLLAKS